MKRILLAIALTASFFPVYAMKRNSYQPNASLMRKMLNLSYALIWGGAKATASKAAKEKHKKELVSGMTIVVAEACKSCSIQ